jgi:hypothetical protein
MSATPGGMHDRWSKLRPYRADDRHDADVLRLLAAFDWAHRDDRPRGDHLNILERSLASRDAYNRRTEARRAELEQRNGAVARSAWKAYQAARERFAAERGELSPAEPSPMIAAGWMGLDPGPLRIY